MSTLEQLWEALGLDRDASSTSVEETRLRDLEGTTLPATLPPPVPEREDLPRVEGTTGALEQDLHVTGLLGEGGMGRVLLAYQRSLGRDVAVKVPRFPPRGVNALAHEARTTGSLEHPGVIPVYALANDAAGLPALVMKRVEGVSWKTLLRNPDDPAWSRLFSQQDSHLDVHVDVLRQVCNVIAFAHQKGVLHRDLKPANVLLGEFGEVYLADWGIARPKPTPDERPKPQLVGSPAYLAPEMVSGDDLRMDERTDVFLLGATLYEVLTGSPPWPSHDLRVVLEQALECRLPPFPPGTPSELAAICSKAMAAEPAQRYQSALELRDALSGYLRHRGSVKLADAAHARLQSLLATLDGPSLEQAYHLLSECRFGFTQALEEWPENEAAREGLTQCLEAMARRELALGNLAAARALLAELPRVPLDLQAAVVDLERREADRHRRHARLEHLSQEFDPRVAFGPRVTAFLATLLAITAVALLPSMIPWVQARLLELGRWYLSFVMVVVLVVFTGAVWFGRRAVLSTRLNRRLIGLVAMAGSGVLAQRLLSVATGLDDRRTVLNNFLYLVLLCITGGITLHSGFFWSALAVAVGLIPAWLFPGQEAHLLAVAAATALGVAMLSWRGWKGELVSRRER